MRILNRQSGRTEGTSDRCEYMACGAPGAGELRGHYPAWRGHVPWTMCAEHLKPVFHPADLHKHLYRWEESS